MTLLTFAAECRAVTSAVAPLMVYARRSAANPPHVGVAVAWWDRQNAISCHRLCSVYSASSVNNWRV